MKARYNTTNDANLLKGSFVLEFLATSNALPLFVAQPLADVFAAVTCHGWFESDDYRRVLADLALMLEVRCRSHPFPRPDIH